MKEMTGFCAPFASAAEQLMRTWLPSCVDEYGRREVQVPVAVVLLHS